MPVYDFENKQRSADMHLGFRVDRAAAAHAAAVTAYFTIAGGPVLLTALVGTVTVEAVGITNFHWETLPTAGAVSPVCALLDVDPAIVGSLLTVTGVGNVAMTYNASATGLAMMTTNVVLPIGALNAEISAASGSTSWSLFYLPLTEAAYVVAA